MTAPIPPNVMQIARAAASRFHSMELGIDEAIGLAIMQDRAARARRPAGMTRSQTDALSFIKSYFAEHGITPTYDEIAAALALRSKSGIHRIVVGLEERGLVTRIPARARSLSIIERTS